jgi:NADH-quinone oxidoreductase subunit N
MNSYNWSDFGALAPVIALVSGACVLLLSEVYTTTGNRRSQPALSIIFALIGAAFSYAQISQPSRDLFGGFARLDGFGSFASLIICLTVAMTSLFAASHLKTLASERGEFHALAHLAASGMILLAITTDLVTLFVALEVMSLAIYALTAYLRSSGRTAEAALKYFVLGSFSSAIFLYGSSLAYGAAGSTRLADIAAAASATGGPSPLLLIAVALILSGFFFKVAAVPFHTWAPDVYEGAPTTVTGFMAAGVKVAAFAAVLRTLYVGFGSMGLPTPTAPGWTGAVTVVAALTMIGGNLLAVAQRSVKRMLAYSSIAHAGYLLVGVVAGADPAARPGAVQAMMFYLAGYTATALGAFAIVAALERRDGPVSDDDSRYDGLAQRQPAFALAMAIFMLSLAGIPPTFGFWGKLYVFQAAMQANLTGLAVLGVVTSIAGLYYYLRVVVVMYMRPATDGAEFPQMPAMGLGLAIACLATVLFGLGPSLLGTLVQQAAKSFGQ